jgi:hypothetical protein
MKIESIKLDKLIPYSRSIRTRNDWSRSRKCIDCGKIEKVRKDNAAKRCAPCSSRINSKAGLDLIKSRANKCNCDHCGKEFGRGKANAKRSVTRFCSLECRRLFSRVARNCKECGRDFNVSKGVLSGKTNSSGNFCSRPCYEKYLCNGQRTTGRGSQWSKIRKQVITSFPFCALCGTIRNLQVHHITPFRLTQDNSKSNLIPLCAKHHKWIEMMFVETERFGVSAETEFIWKNMIRSKQADTAAKIKRIISCKN